LRAPAQPEPFAQPRRSAGREKQNPSAQNTLSFFDVFSTAVKKAVDKREKNRYNERTFHDKWIAVPLFKTPWAYSEGGKIEWLKFE
jgi:hypothetical protein